MTTSNDMWDSILEDPGMEEALFEENKILKPLLSEIGLIVDLGIRSFVRSVLLKADVFWYIPSSFSGKYHPPDERGLGGNVLHTKRVVRVTEMLSDSFGLDEYERDLVLAAALIHDVTKGRVWDENIGPQYDPFHPYTVDTFVKEAHRLDEVYGREDKSSVMMVTEDTMRQILRLVRCHMGPWSPIPETIPLTNTDMVVHCADNIASKLHEIIDGKDEVREERWLLNPDGNLE